MTLLVIDAGEYYFRAPLNDEVLEVAKMFLAILEEEAPQK